MEMTLQLAAPGTLDINGLLELAASRATLDIELGRLDLSRPDTRRLLKEMAKLRQERYFGLALRGSIGRRVTLEQAALLRDAGVTSVQLAQPLEPGAPPGAVAVALRQLEAVKLLFEADVQVDWQLERPDDSSAPSVQDHLIGIMAMARHLPPPREFSCSGASNEAVWERSTDAGRQPRQTAADALEDALQVWRSSFRPCSLTYARGPGFIRIRDRRGAESHWTFVTLTERQADVFLFCRTVRALAEIEAFAPDVPKPHLTRFLASMAARGLVCSIGSFHLSLPIRRRIEERWSSDVY